MKCKLDYWGNLKQLGTLQSFNELQSHAHIVILIPRREL